MKVVFRADASVELGTGHVMRCLTLAEALKERGVEVCFASVALPGNLIEYICEQGYSCYILAQTDELIQDYGDWLIVDHYQLGFKWEFLMRAYFNRIVVIDDLVNRNHDCDILLNQNLYLEKPNYNLFIPSKATILLGPEYALLRKEFDILRDKVKPRNKVKKIFVFFGGSDPTNETLKALQALGKIQKKSYGLEVDVVIGANNPNSGEIRRFCLDNSFRLHCQINYMGILMVNADLAIGAGGTATWERYALGLPSICWSIAENQENNLFVGDKLKTLFYLGDFEDVTSEMCERTICKIIESPQLLEEYSRKCMTLVDGKGSERVCDFLVSK